MRHHASHNCTVFSAWYISTALNWSWVYLLQVQTTSNWLYFRKFALPSQRAQKAKNKASASSSCSINTKFTYATRALSAMVNILIWMKIQTFIVCDYMKHFFPGFEDIICRLLSIAANSLYIFLLMDTYKISSVNLYF